jgi:predicted nucleotide-binding protein (sugar kinase/HSP70/actin superfamily)
VLSVSNKTIMPSVAMQSVAMQSVAMLSFLMLSVVLPASSQHLKVKPSSPPLDQCYNQIITVSYGFFKVNSINYIKFF